MVPIYPSSTAGDFTVTATIDGSILSTIFDVRIAAQEPRPTINQVANHDLPGLTPALFLLNPADAQLLVIRGTGFTEMTIPVFKSAAGIDTALFPAFVNQTEVHASVPPEFLTQEGNAQIRVTSFAAGDSNSVDLLVTAPVLAAAGTTISIQGSTSLLGAPGAKIEIPPVSLVNPIGASSHVATGTTSNVAGGDNAKVISNDGASIVTDGGSGLITQDGGSLVGNSGGTLVSHDGGTSVGMSSGTVSVSGSAAASGQPKTAATTFPVTGNYYSSTDKYGLFFSPPVSSNGIPGTYTRTVSIDGISAPVIFTITNLNPNDGHPAAITSLSKTTAAFGDAAFTLTVTGTGFVSGSVLQYAGVQLPTTFTSPTQVSATIPASLLKYGGSFSSWSSIPTQRWRFPPHLLHRHWW